MKASARGCVRERGVDEGYGQCFFGSRRSGAVYGGSGGVGCDLDLKWRGVFLDKLHCARDLVSAATRG
jgi:hypothetical protein